MAEVEQLDRLEQFTNQQKPEEGLGELSEQCYKYAVQVNCFNPACAMSVYLWRFCLLPVCPFLSVVVIYFSDYCCYSLRCVCGVPHCRMSLAVYGSAVICDNTRNTLHLKEYLRIFFSQN